MKFTLTCLLLSFVAPPRTVSLQEVDALRAEIPTWLASVAQVESSGRLAAVGDNGKALGQHQIWRTYWADALEFCPQIGGTYRDVTQAVYSDRIVCAYWLRYCPDAVRRRDWQTLARVHNGGPAGARSPATVGYWRRVEREFAKQIQTVTADYR